MGKYTIESLRKTEVVIVKDLSDMPAHIGGVITLEDKEYWLDAEISSPWSLKFPGTDNRTTIRGINRNAWIYTGTGACFQDLDARGDIELHGLNEFKAPNGNMFDCATAGGSASFQTFGGTRFTDMNSIGHIKGPNFGWSVFFGTISNFDTGFDIEDVDFFEINTTFVFGNNVATTFFNVHGDQTLGPINFLLISAAVGTNEIALNLNPDIKKTVNSILLQSNQTFGGIEGAVFAPGSLTQADPIVTSQGNAAFPDSTVKAKLNIATNSLVSDIINPNAHVPINALWSDGTIEERLVFRDDCIFDNITNTITAFNNILAVPAAFNHDMENGEIVTFQSNGGLPPEILTTEEYFVINKTATTFQVSLTSGGPAVTFSTDGTAPNYYDHVHGTSATGWVIYIGLSDVSLIVQGWVGIDKTGTAENAGTHVIKTDTSFVETQQARGSTITVQQGKGQSSMVSDIVNLSTGEGVKIFIENREGSDDLIVTGADITFNKA